jgi:hypothetical protein
MKLDKLIVFAFFLVLPALIHDSSLASERNQHDIDMVNSDFGPRPKKVIELIKPKLSDSIMTALDPCPILT